MKPRYTLKQAGFEDVFQALSFKDATDLASHMLEADKQAAVTITDHRARKGKPKQYTVKTCTGEAHSNPYIDHCPVCMPNWGIVIRSVKNAEMVSSAL